MARLLFLPLSQSQQTESLFHPPGHRPAKKKRFWSHCSSVWSKLEKGLEIHPPTDARDVSEKGLEGRQQRQKGMEALGVNKRTAGDVLEKGM